MTDNKSDKKLNIDLIKDVLDRLYDIEVRYHLTHADRMTLACQLMQVDAQVDLNRLMTFQDHDFVHDVYGINTHVTAESNEFQNCFYPRCGV